MKSSKTHTVPYRRKREAKTNYKKRLGLLKSGLPRLVIRTSLTGVTVQIIKYSPAGDKVLVSAHSNELKKIGWKISCSNTPASYLVGSLIAQKAKKAKIKEAVFDAGLYKPVRGSRLYAVVKGAIDNGLSVNADEAVLPSEDRISGKHIEEYAKSIEKDADRYKRQFSGYLKQNVDPRNITKAFNEALSKIKGV
jgi:large subunit ribosomal protein L18